jgi:hypothetical protein
VSEAVYDKFIGIYDNAFTDKFCDDLIAHYEWCHKNNMTYPRQAKEKVKKDTSLNLSPFSFGEINFATDNICGYLAEFNRVFWNVCYADYLNKYSVLAGYAPHTIYSYKLQHTGVSEGYHVWHCEDSDMEGSRRVGAYMIYLNDVEEGGETEFLYQAKRIKPKKGRLLIFPPNYPWAHRGNPPLSGSKYILTGWTEFT